MSVRDCVKAGSWYVGKKEKLKSMMENWLDDCKVDSKFCSKVLIGPHAGYRHCGATLAKAFGNINIGRNIKTVFILGPSHKFRFQGCALSSCKIYKTPLGDLPVHNISPKLLENDLFCDIGRKREENEHSIEMHLPFVRLLFPKDCEIVPIMVSQLDGKKSAEKYAEVLFPYFCRDDTFFCVSSDFCHWGPRFRYTHKFPNISSLNESIEHLDKLGVEAIFSNDIDKWNLYLEKYRNTICGRRCISIILEIMKILKTRESGEFCKFNWKLVGYHQSNKNLNENETSVSYASCFLYK